jgi:hypothetical protein
VSRESPAHDLRLYHPPTDLLPCNYLKGGGVLLSWDQGPNLVGQSSAERTCYGHRSERYIQRTAATFSKHRYIRRDGSARECRPYWHFHFHKRGKGKKLYLGKTSDPESTLVAKRA